MKSIKRIRSFELTDSYVGAWLAEDEEGPGPIHKWLVLEPIDAIGLIEVDGCTWLEPLNFRGQSKFSFSFLEDDDGFLGTFDKNRPDTEILDELGLPPDLTVKRGHWSSTFPPDLEPVGV